MHFPPDLVDKLYTGVLSDVLDELGHYRQAMRPFVRPLDETLSFIGRARTGLYAPTYYVAPDDNPYELEIALLDAIEAGDVAVIGCNGPTDRLAPWGELLTTAAMARGGVGCVTDGLVRDTRMIKGLRFPVFHGGIGPLDSRGRGRMVEIDTTIECGGVSVCKGDLIFGDSDGVVVLPAAISSAVIQRALEKAGTENRSREELRKGILLADVYRKYGVL